MRDRAAKYRRISEDREGRELGIDRQNEDLDALAERHDLAVVADYVDNDLGASTRSRKPRPSYLRLIEDAKAGKFEVILAYTTGRLTRRPREHEVLIDLAQEHGIRFEYVRSPSFDLNTAQGRRIARTLAAQDAGESEEMAERVARAALQRAQQGRYHGGRRCFGYAKDGMSLESAEAAEITKSAEGLLAGVPLGRLVRDLNDRGITTVGGRAWVPNTLRDLLKAPRIAGLAVHRGEVVGKGQWPAVITEEMHHAITALLADPSRRTTTGNRAGYLLSGIATCAKCGGSITSFGIKRNPTGGTRYLYRCRSGACVARRRDWVDGYVTEAVIARLSRDDARGLLVDDSKPDLGPLRVEGEAIRVRMGELVDSFADGQITKAQLDRGNDRMRGRLTEIEAAMVHVDRAPVLADLVGADDVRAAWDGLSLDRKRAVVKTLMTVTLHPGGGGKRTFDHTKVEIVFVS